VNGMLNLGLVDGAGGKERIFVPSNGIRKLFSSSFHLFNIHCFNINDIISDKENVS